jgi:hypothetical protein
MRFSKATRAAFIWAISWLHVQTGGTKCSRESGSKRARTHAHTRIHAYTEQYWRQNVAHQTAAAHAKSRLAVTRRVKRAVRQLGVSGVWVPVGEGGSTGAFTGRTHLAQLLCLCIAARLHACHALELSQFVTAPRQRGGRGGGGMHKPMKHTIHEPMTLGPQTWKSQCKARYTLPALPQGAQGVFRCCQSGSQLFRCLARSC